MKMTKKALALVMAVIMLASVFTFSASALTYSPSLTTGEVGLILKADKTTVNPGDVVTFSICVDKGSKGDFGPWMTTIIYNGNQIAPTSTTNTEFRQYTNECANFMKQTSTVNFNYPIAQLTTLTTEEKAYYTKAILMNGVVDTSLTTNAAGNGWTPADSATPQCVFTMKIAADVAPGTEIWVGNHDATYTKGVSYMSPAGSSRYANTVYNLTNSMVKLTVASSSSSILNPFKSQIRFDKNTDGTYAGTFDVRQLAVVSKADFESTFGATTAEQIAAIAEVGFVFARTSTVATFDVAAAKALVESGTPAAGYTKKTVDYITTNAVVGTGNYGFSCIVEDIPTADNTDGMNALAYIKGTDGTYHYYPAAQSTSFNSLYTTHYTDAFPG